MDKSPVQDLQSTPVQDVLSTPAKQGTSPGWGQIAQLQTPVSAKRRDAKARVHRFVRAGRQQAPAQAQTAGPTAQSILTVHAAIAQHPTDTTRSNNILGITQLKKCSQPDDSEPKVVKTTFAACLAEAGGKDSGVGDAGGSRQSQSRPKYQANKNRGVRDGGHENFVRLASKKGKSSFSYKSKSGSSNKNPKNRKWAARKMAAESLPVAGLGADSTKEAHLICFKCGQKGHWAADCKAELPTGQKENVNMAWCVTDTAVLNTDASALPTILYADAAAVLAAYGGMPSAPTGQGEVGPFGACAEQHSIQYTAHQHGAQCRDKACSPEQDSGLQDSLVNQDVAVLDDCFEAAAQVACDEPTDTAPPQQSISTRPSDAPSATDAYMGASTSKGLRPIESSYAADWFSHDVEELVSVAQQGRDSSVHIFGDRKSSHVDDTLRNVLRDALGFQDFRSFQLPVIRQLLQGRSSMVIQPTGSGKSLCFQLPALLLPGLVIVVSPLTAHARDAVSRLPKSVPAGLCLGGDFKRASMATLAAAEAGRLKLLYITPECLAASWVAERLGRTHISMVCVDEAHVASALSPSCRAGCLRVPSLISSIAPDAVRLLLTATAGPELRSDLASAFAVTCSSIWTAPPLRPELKMCVEKHTGSAGDGRCHSAVLAALAPNGPLGGCECTLVYCTFCAHAEQLSSYLQGRGVAAASYHGSLSAVARQSVAERLAAGKLKVVTCTTALSSGLDLHNIDGILHQAMPASLEDYVQQIGRAGRAGQPARAVVLLRDADFHLLHSLKHTLDCDMRAVKHVLRGLFVAATGKVEVNAATKKAAAKAASAAKKRAQKKGGKGKKDQENDSTKHVNSCASAGQKRKRSKTKPDTHIECPDGSSDALIKAGAKKSSSGPCADASGTAEPKPQNEGSDAVAEAASFEDRQPRKSSRLVRSCTTLSTRHMPLDDGLQDSADVCGKKGCDDGNYAVLEDSDSDAAPDSEEEQDDDDDTSEFEESPPQRRRRLQRRKAVGAEAPLRKLPVGANGHEGSPCGDTSCVPSAGENMDAVGASCCKGISEVGACATLASGALPDGAKEERPQGTEPAAGRTGMRSSSHGTYIVVQLRDVAQGAQVTVDAVQTILAMLEKVLPKAVRVLGNVMPAFKVACYRQKPEELAEKEPLFAAIQSVARTRNGTLSAKTQDVARYAQVAPDAIEDVLQRLAAKGEVYLEGKRDLSVAVWIDPESDVWQGMAEHQQGGNEGVAVETGPMAHDVLTHMKNFLNTQVSKLELVYAALESVQQLPPAQQSDALAECISREFPADTHAHTSDMHEITKCIDRGAIAEMCIIGDVEPEAPHASPQGLSPQHTSSAMPSLLADNQPAQPNLPFEPVGKMTAIKVAATVEHAAERAGPKVQLTARAIASIMHGRDTPAFPRSSWSKCPGWGSCMHVRFVELRAMVQKELLKQAGGQGAW